MPNVKAVVASNTVKARVGSQKVTRVLSNASAPPTKLIDLDDVNSTLRNEDGLLIVWDFPSQTFIMTSVIDSTSSTIGGIAYYTNTTDNILGDSNTGSVQIDGGVGIDKNLTVGAGLSVFSSATFNSGLVQGTIENTLGNPDTGAFQVDGGVGINKNLTVGGGFYVQGASEFIGVATFRGGTINIGDEDTDDINVGGEFISNLVPNDDDSYDLGSEVKRWRNGFFSSTLSSNSLIISGVSTFNDNVFVSGITSTTNLFVSGSSTFLDDLNLVGDLSIVGFVSVTEGLYYDADDYDGPNGVAYFDSTGKLVSGISTESAIDTSNYILTTLETAGIGTPVWTSTIDGGEY